MSTTHRGQGCRVEAKEDGVFQRIRTTVARDGIAMKYVCLTIHGHYLHTGVGPFDGPMLLADGTGQGVDSIFERINVINDRVVLRCLDGQYVSQSVTALANVRVVSGYEGAAGAFLEVRWPDDRVSLRTNGGRFLSAVGGGGAFVTVDPTEAGEWEKFYYEVPAPELLPPQLPKFPTDAVVHGVDQPVHAPPLAERVTDIDKKRPF